MFELTFDPAIDSAKTVKDTSTAKGVIPARDAFRKPRFRKYKQGEAYEKDPYTEDMSILGIPFLCNLVQAYAVFFARASGVEYVTLSLMLAIAKEIGIDVNEVRFNHFTFRQQLIAQIKFDKRILPVTVYTGKASVCKVAKGKKMSAFTVNPKDEARLEACITYC